MSSAPKFGHQAISSRFPTKKENRWQGLYPGPEMIAIFGADVKVDNIIGG